MRRLVDAAENRHAAYFGVAAVGLKAFADLQRQFPRGGKDQRADFSAAAIHTTFDAAEPLQDGQGEGGRLSGAGFGAAEHVAAFEHGRNGGRLDGGGGVVALGFNRAEQWFGQAEFFKLHQHFFQTRIW